MTPTNIKHRYFKNGGLGSDWNNTMQLWAGKNSQGNFVTEIAFTLTAPATSITFTVASSGVNQATQYALAYKLSGTETDSNYTNGGASTGRDGTFTLSSGSTGSATFTININLPAGENYLYIFDGSYYGVYNASTLNGNSTSISYDAILASSVSAPNGIIGEPLSISISPQMSGLTHTLEYSFGNASGTIVTKTASTSVSWTPAMSLCNQIPNAVSGICTITCKTYSGNTHAGTTTTTHTLSVPDSVKPTVADGWVSVSPYNTEATAAMNAYIQGYSKAEVAFDNTKITTAYGATIASYKIVFNGVAKTTIPYRTDLLTTKGNMSIACYVYDTRGRSASVILAFEVLEYNNPSISGVACFRCTNAGVASDSGTYISIKATANYSGLNGLNNSAIKYRYKQAGGSFGNYTIMTSGTASIFGGGTIDTTKSYVVEILQTDTLGNTDTVSISIATQAVTFALKDGGKGAAFGKYPEADNVLDVAWDLKIKGKTLLDWLHPVNSYYMSDDPTNPAELFGGAWEQIKDRVLIGAGGKYAVGETGGSETHTLTKAQLPATPLTMPGMPLGENYTWEAPHQRIAYVFTADNPYPSNVSTNNLGEGQAFSLLNPYYAVYIWLRIA